MLKLTTLLAILAVLAILLANWSDFRSEQDEQAFYCAMVADGTWPDYRGTYRKECK